LGNRIPLIQIGLLNDPSEVVVVASEVARLVIVRVAAEGIVQEKLCLSQRIFNPILACVGVATSSTITALITSRILSVV
jgi:hypothetical protein